MGTPDPRAQGIRAASPRTSPLTREQGHATGLDGLLTFLVAYGAASLLHHVHNAELLNEYPNLPGWLSRAGVYGAWLGVTAVGLAGYFLIRSRYRLPGLVVLGIYGALGLDGLGHYAVAPLSMHTLAMNLTIGFEVGTAVLLLIAVASSMLRLLRKDRQAVGADKA